jgi:phosphoglycolate phosphatase-like HAD superfamily hydrolase
MQRGFGIAAFSNSNTRTVKETFRRNSIAGYFQNSTNLAIVGGDYVGKSPEAVIMALRLAGAEVEGSYVVGDTKKDVDSGREAGVDARNTLLLVREGPTPEGIDSRTPIIRQLTEMLYRI